MTRTRAPQQYSNEALLELGRLALKVAGNPKTRRPFLNAVREIEPDRVFPDQQVEDLRQEWATQRETDNIERERRETEQRLAAQRRKLIDSKRFTEDDVKKIEKDVMERLGLADYDAAATIYGAQQPAAPSNTVPKSGGVWELPTFDGLLKDPNGAARNMAFQVIDELAANRRSH